jgi:hypothetical protein
MDSATATPDTSTPRRRATALYVALGVLLVVCGLVFLVGLVSTPSRSADQAKNLAFLRTIAVFPKSTLIATNTYKLSPDGDMVGEGFLNPSPGYATELTYLLPRGVDLKTAVAFYRREFKRHGWTAQEGDNTSDPYVAGVYLIARADGVFIIQLDVFERRDGRIVAVL